MRSRCNAKTIKIAAVLAAVLATPLAQAQSDLAANFRINGGITILANEYTHMAVDVDFTTRFVRLTGSIFNLTGSPSFPFFGSCEDRNPAANLLLCNLSINGYSGVMSISLADLGGNLTVVSLIGSDTDTAIISFSHID